MKVAVLVLCFVGLAFGKSFVPDGIDGFDVERPSYNLTGDQPKDFSYEVRKYDSAMWVATVVEAITEDEARITGLKRLFDYINGSNEGGVKIDMTMPILTEISGNPCAFCTSDFTFYFYIPSIYQAFPPVPTDENVYLTSRYVSTFYVRYISSDAVVELPKVEAHRLVRDLERNNVTYSDLVTESMFLAEYNNPINRQDRHMEIWLMALGGFDDQQYLYNDGTDSVNYHI